MRSRRPIGVRGVALLCTLIAMSFAAAHSEARVVSIQTSGPTIAFGGYSWPGVGQYVKITGVAYAEVDPTDPRNSLIVDIGLAQLQGGANQPGKTASGKVAYLLNFYILKPADLNAVDPTLNGFGKVMYEPPNRGNKTWTALGRVTGGGNDPASITDPTVLANSFLMPRGYTLVWSGWEPLVPLANLGTSLTAAVALPVAKKADGSTITGPAYEYIVTAPVVPPTPPITSFTLSYPAANSADKASAKLTHRVHLDDPAAQTDTVPAFGSAQCVAPVAFCWEYTSAAGTAIRLVSPAHAILPFIVNDIYEFSYTAKDPTVAGLGFAAVRDWNSFLRYDTSASNPLANYITRIYTEISSQPGRMFNDFRNLGFNEDESGRKVFDGHMQWIAAGDGIGMNYRFSQSGRTERNRQDHLYPEAVFPFANVPTTDPFTGITTSRYAKCQLTNTCAFGVEIYSANEYWVKAASLLTTKADGSADLPDSPYTRNYFMSSMQHGTGNAANRGNCQQFQNPLNSAPVQRALFLALDAWTFGTLPPASRVPRLADGTLVLPADTGFPTNIPDPFGETPNGKVTYTGLKTTRYRFDYGAGFYTTGIPSIFPPVIVPPLEVNTSVPMLAPNGPIYPSFAPTTDSDGNDIAGVRLPDVTVPLATYTGWGLRRGAQANDGCESAGQFIPFASTKTERKAAGDPRPSVEERYPSFGQYRSAVMRAIDDLVKDRLLLCEDVPDQQARLLQAGLDAGVPEPSGHLPPQTTTPHCLGEKANR
jgi:hypothetical protein